MAAVALVSQPVLVFMGVSGAGKSTLAKAVAARLGWVFQEGDELHPATNVAKMKSGRPLTDADRAPWLARIAAWIDAQAHADRAAIISCSALKRRYRQVLTEGRPFVRIVYLKGSRELIGKRLAARKGHYFPASLLASQFEALEPPGPEERPIVIDVSLPIDAQVDQIVAAVAPAN